MVDQKKQSNSYHHILAIALSWIAKAKYAVAILKLALFFIVTIILVPIYLTAKFGPNINSNNFDFLIRSFWSKFG